MKLLVSRCSSLILALAIAAASATAAATSEPDSTSIVSDLPIPGGVAGLLRAADIPANPDPATAMLAFVRVAHVLGSKPPEQAIRYLDAITRLRAASAALPGHEASVPTSGAATPLLQAWAAACGLSLAPGTVKEAEGAEAASRRRALVHSGLPIADWIRRLNAGETVRVEIVSENVPLPLSADVWMSAVFKGRVPREQLARAVFGERRAALVYHGLVALDDETLAYIGSHPTLLSAIADRSPGVFAEWGRAIHIRNAHVQLPGGDLTSALWEEVVGHSPGDTDGFIQALLARDGGAAAFFVDTVAHLDPPRQAFALALGGKEDRVERIRALYRVFSRTTTFDSSSDWPVVRHPFNPAAVLREVMADPVGSMAAPSSRGLWDVALGGASHACAQAADDGRRVDAAWLAERIEREPLSMRGHWLGAVTFAQRVFPRAKASDLPAVCEAVTAFPHSDGLLLTLERIGFDTPADYSNILRFAGRTWAGLDRRAAVIRTAQVQGVLAILERAVAVRVLTSARARSLALSLAALAPGASSGTNALPPDDGRLAAGAIGRWIRGTLLSNLCTDQPSADGCLVRAVSGEGAPGGAGRLVSWEDERYRVDLGAGTVVRIERVREALRATGIDEALNVLAAATTLADARASAAELDRAATMLKALKPALNLDLAELFGHPVPHMRPVFDSAIVRLAAGQSANDRAEAAAGLLDVSDTLLADALLSFAYAMAIGDPDDAVLLGGNPARRHRFDATTGPATEAWHLPEEMRDVDRTWLVEGSVLLLRAVYAPSWQRRISVQDTGARPRPDPQDVRAFAESAATFNAFDLTDAGRDAIVSAIQRGRERVVELLRTPELLWKTASEIGLGEWRCRAALWASRGEAGTTSTAPGRAVSLFSLTELMRLGRPDIPQEQIDAWGVATRRIDGGAWVRMPHAHTWEDVQGPRGVGVLPTQLAEVHLRVAEALSEFKLPAVLAPDVAAYAGWDAMTSAEMAHPDDWFALARAAQSLPRDRFLDYVSALTAIGPLVPVR